VDLVSSGFRLLLGLVFVASSVPKLRSADEFVIAVRNYALLRPSLARPVARSLPWLELACGLALLAGVAVPAVAPLAAVILGLFAVAVSANLVRGRSIECGCYGGFTPRKISWSLVAWDIALLGLALTVAAHPVTPLPAWSPGSEQATLGVGDGIGLATAAFAVFLCQMLLGEAARVRRLSNAHRHQHQEVTW